jgi:type VI secretion system protein ImpF
MARRDAETPITLPLLDRLIDREPDLKSEMPLTRSQSMRLFKEALKRDLEWLLNARRTPDEAGEEYPELAASLYNFGLPDITSLGLHSTPDQNRLRKSLETALTTFEPRLMSVRIQMEGGPSTTKGLHFHIRGLMRVDPSPEQVYFDTVLELPAGEYEVRGD